MTKAQAAALSAQLEARSMPHSIIFAWPNGGAELVTVELDPTKTYLTPDVKALADYCTTQGLSLSLLVDKMGVV